MIKSRPIPITTTNTFCEHFQFTKVCISSQERKENKFLFISGSGGCKYCKTSFLFSLVNPSGARPTLLPLKGAANKNGICCSKSIGPSFGGGPDLCIANGANANSESCSHLGNSYECPPDADCNTFLAGQNYFVVTELEVFAFF